MKMKMTLSVLIIVLGSFLPTFSQDKAKASGLTDVVWLGVDFTAAKFTVVPENPAVIVNQYLQSINTLIITEVEKFDIKKFFNKSGVVNSIDQVNEKNSKIDPSSFVINNEYKLDPEAVKAIIKKYNVPEKSGTALVFIAENLNKTTQTGSFYVCFFDLATKEIIDCTRMVGKAVGIGFRNYWAGSVYNVMKGWMKEK
jgi:hypothetical protein